MSPIVSGGGSGGSQPVLVEDQYGTEATAVVGDDSIVHMSWARTGGGNLCQLNLTDPTAPVVTVNGWYTMLGYIYFFGADQTGKYVSANSTADVNFWDAGTYSSAVALVKRGGLLTIPVGFSWYMEAGQVMRSHVFQDSGVTLNFYLYAYLTRLTGITGASPPH